MYLNTKDYFVKQISHLSDGVVIVTFASCQINVCHITSVRTEELHIIFVLVNAKYFSHATHTHTSKYQFCLAWFGMLYCVCARIDVIRPKITRVVRITRPLPRKWHRPHIPTSLAAVGGGRFFSKLKRRIFMEVGKDIILKIKLFTYLSTGFFPNGYPKHIYSFVRSNTLWHIDIFACDIWNPRNLSYKIRLYVSVKLINISYSLR